MFSETAAVLRSLPRPFRTLLLGIVLNRVATFIVPFLTLALTRDRGLTDAEAGLVFLAYGAGSVASLLVGGLLTDALGRRRTMLLSLLGAGTLAAGLGFARDTRLFVATLLLYGFIGDLYRPAVHSVMADLLPSERRAEGTAALRTAVNVGWAVGLSLGGLLADLGPKVLFLADGLTTIAFGFVVMAGVPETRRGGAAAEPLRPGDLPRALARDPVLRGVVLCTVAWSLYMVCFMTVFPLTVEQWAGYPPVVYGLTLGLNGLLVALLQIPVSGRVARFRRLRTAALGMALGALAVAALPAFRRWEWFFVVMTVATLAEMLFVPLTTAFLSDWAPPEVRGTYLGLHQAAFSLAFALSPVVMLPLRRAVGDGWFWPLLLLPAVPAIPVLLRMDREADRPERLRGASAP